MVPRLLTEEQKAQRLNACQDILQQMEADKKLLENIITGEESWVFQYDPETKQHSRQWKCPCPVEKYVLAQKYVLVHK